MVEFQWSNSYDNDMKVKLNTSTIEIARISHTRSFREPAYKWTGARYVKLLWYVL